MFLWYFMLFPCIWNLTLAQEIEILSNILDSRSTPIKVIEADVLLLEKIQSQDKVTVQLYYECLCPDCIEIDPQFVNVVKKIQEDHLNIYTYPYGNARTIVHDNGEIEFECQHGPAECYGNKLHACAINILPTITQALEFNACMMSPDRGNSSDDPAANECAQIMHIDAKPIKDCAKSDKGNQLLKHYGEESEKAGFHYVPYILINGKEWTQDSGIELMHAVCAAFAVPPPACEQENEIK